MGKVVINIRQMIYLLRFIQKISLILEVNPVRGIQGIENQEVNLSPSQRRKSSVIIVKNIGFINLSV